MSLVFFVKTGFDSKCTPSESKSVQEIKFKYTAYHAKITCQINNFLLFGYFKRKRAIEKNMIS